MCKDVSWLALVTSPACQAWHTVALACTGLALVCFATEGIAITRQALSCCTAVISVCTSLTSWPSVAIAALADKGTAFCFVTCLSKISFASRTLARCAGDSLHRVSKVSRSTDVTPGSSSVLPTILAEPGIRVSLVCPTIAFTGDRLSYQVYYNLTLGIAGLVVPVVP